jgi:hypothetical protein
MSSLKTTTLYGLLAKLETSYLAAGSTLAHATDGVLCEPDGIPVPSRAWLYDGDRGRAAGTGGWRKNTTPRGATRSGTVKVAVRGAGAAYDDSPLVVPLDLHLFMLASGHSATIVPTPGSESVTYAPRTGPSSFESIVMQWDTYGDRYKVLGVRGNIRLMGDGVGRVTADFDFDGVDDAAAYAEQVTPTAVTYNDTVPPILSDNMTFSLGSFVTPVVRRFSFDAGRQRSPRQNLAAAGGHFGWTFGHRTPMLEVAIEKAALVGSPFHTSGGLDPYRLHAAGTSIAVSVASLQTGMQYNRFTLSHPTAQIVGVSEEDDGGSALMVLQIKPHCSTPSTNDDYTLAFT